MPNRATALLLWYILTACCFGALLTPCCLQHLAVLRRDDEMSVLLLQVPAPPPSRFPPPPIPFDFALFFSHACFLRSLQTSEWRRCVYCGPRRPKRCQSRHQTAAHGALRKYGQVNTSGMLRVVSIPQQLRHTRLMCRVCSNPLLRSISQARA